MARRAATLRRRLATEPALRRRYNAHLDTTRSGTLNEYRLRRLRASKLPDWVPIDQRGLYRELRDARLTPAEIREALATQTAVDARTFAQSGKLQHPTGDTA